MSFNSWKDVWMFTRSERRGVIVLIILAVLSALYSYFMPDWYSNKKIKKFEEEFACELNEGRTSSSNDQSSIIILDTSKPQKSDADSLIQRNNQKSISEKIPEPITSFEINSVSAKTLIQVGVQQEVAYRIVKFREKLGGFYAIQQLKDVFGLTDSEYNLIASKYTINKNHIKRIDFNAASFEQLSAHPYISSKLANQIISFRTKYKPFESSEDVNKLYLVDDELFKKLNPYVSY